MQHIEKNELISHFVLTLWNKYQNQVAYSENIIFTFWKFLWHFQKIFDLIASNTFLDMVSH